MFSYIGYFNKWLCIFWMINVWFKVKFLIIFFFFGGWNCNRRIWGIYWMRIIRVFGIMVCIFVFLWFLELFIVMYFWRIYFIVVYRWWGMSKRMMLCRICKRMLVVVIKGYLVGRRICYGWIFLCLFRRRVVGWSMCFREVRDFIGLRSSIWIKCNV